MTPRPNVKLIDAEILTKRKLDAHWAWQEGRRFTPRDDYFVTEVIAWCTVFFLLSLAIWWVVR